VTTGFLLLKRLREISTNLMDEPKKTSDGYAPIDWVAITIATAGGAGFFPRMPGTIGSLVGVVLYVLLETYGLTRFNLPLLLILVVVGVWSSTHVERLWGHDASRIVIDEVAGQMLTLGFVTRSGQSDIVTGAILGFLLFRFFDILKPFPIRRLERLPSGVGVVADDLGAGVYAFLVLILLESLSGRFL
jgi:phosphatidylglycerophosphatase A